MEKAYTFSRKTHNEFKIHRKYSQDIAKVRNIVKDSFYSVQITYSTGTKAPPD